MADRNVGGIYGEIVIDTHGIERDLRAVEAQIDNITTEFRAGAMAFDQYESKLGQLANKAEQLRSTLKMTASDVVKANEALGHFGVSTAGTKALGSEMDRAGRSARGLANNVMIVGQTIDDLQYVGTMGIRPIANNLMQLNPKIGIAAVGLAVLAANWDAIKTKAEGTAFEKPFKLLNDWLVHVGQSLHLVNDGIEQMKEAADGEWDVLGKIRGKEEQGRASAARETIEGMGGGQAVTRAMVEKFRPGREAVLGRKLTDEEAARLRAEMGAVVLGAAGGDANAVGKLGKALPEFAAGMAANAPGRKGAQAREEAEAKRIEDEAIRLQEERQRDREQFEKERAERAADAYEDTYNARAEMGGDGGAIRRRSHAELRGRLVATGMGMDDADATSRAALDTLEQKFKGRVDASMVGGKSREEALLAMRNEREDKRRGEEEKRDREALAAAQDLSPSMAGRAQDAYLRSVMSGNNANAVGRQIGDQAAAALKAKGMDPDQAERAGRLVSADARSGAEREMAQREESIRSQLEKQQPRNAELIGGAELYSRVVSGVGPSDKTDRMIRELQQIREAVTRPDGGRVARLA